MSYEDETDHGKYTSSELLTILHQYLSQGQNDDETESNHKREDALDQYRRIPLREGAPGKSQFVTGEVVETVEWCHASLMRGFLSRQNMVGFKPRHHTPEHEARADQATALVNYYIRDRDGAFETLYKVVKDVLLYPTAYARVGADYKTWTETQRYTGLDAIAFASLLEDSRADTVKVLDVVAHPQLDEMGQPVVAPDGTEAIATYDALVSKVYGRWVPEYYPVAPFRMFIDANHTDTSLEDCNFVCEAQVRSRGDWITMGLDPEKLDRVASDGHGHLAGDHSEMIGLHTDTGTGVNVYPFVGADPDEDMRMITLYRAIVRLDYDGDGEPERRQILFGGDCIFLDEPIDTMPYIACSAYMVSHRAQGFSLQELIKEIQELKTQLMRHMLDNLNDLGNSRIFVHEDQLRNDGWTLDGLLDPRSNFVITAQPPSVGVMPEPKHSHLQDILAAMNYADETRRVRSGVAPELQLNPDVISKGTAHAFMGALDATGQRIEMLARVITEMLIKPIAKKFHDILRTHQDQPLAEKINGRWVHTTPSDWEADAEVEVYLGLGHNNQQQMLQMLMQLLPIQQQAIAANLANPKTIYESLAMLVEYAGLGPPEKFFVDPAGPGWQPPQPPPPTPKEQAEMASMQAEAQARAKGADADLVRAQATLIDAETKRIQAADNAREDAAAEEREGFKAMADMAHTETQTQALRAEMMRENRKLALELQKMAAEIAALRRPPETNETEP